jgi:hypothetical protein
MGTHARIVGAALLALLAGPAVAQHHQHHPQPYAGQQQRAVKALSPQQVADLEAGRGMGLALAAELNGYPGPLHVLELKDKLGLSAGQAQRVQDLYDSMKAEAIAAGEVLISAEVALDRGFAEGGMTPEKLSDLTARAGVAQGRLRAVHLKYHLTTSDLLTDAQKRRYAELRGYR